MPPSHTDTVGQPSAPRIGGDVFRYRLHTAEGDDVGEATYAVMIKPVKEPSERRGWKSA